MAGKDFRAKLATDLEEDYETVRDFLKDAIAATRKVWHTCPHCKHRSEVEITDVKSGLQAAQLWIDQGFGKTAQSAVKPDQPLDHTKPADQYTPEERKAWITRLQTKLAQEPQERHTPSS